MALLNVAFVIVLFTVGWTMSDLITGLFISESGYRIMIPQGKILLTFIKLTGFFKPESAEYAKLLPKDPIALVFLSTIEVFFYRFFFKEMKN
jgi:hypothetical protein